MHRNHKSPVPSPEQRKRLNLKANRVVIRGGPGAQVKVFMAKAGKQASEASKKMGGYRGNHGKAVQTIWTTLEVNPFSSASVEYSCISGPGVAHSGDGW